MVVEKGYAKINLGLEVVGKREDGYHDLDMIMTSLNLYDELYFEDHPGKNIIIECAELAHLEPKSNLVYKAIETLRERFGIERGVKVRIVKRIPEQAGLGGGSADCAATLRAINKLWNLGLSLAELAKIGAEIGSDVPFCIYNKTARLKGRGEIIEFIEDMPFTYLVLVLPPFRNSTAQIFQNFTVHHENSDSICELESAVNAGELNKIAGLLFNDLEKGVDRTEIGEIKRDLLAAGALGAVMTGSGSAVYGLCLNNEKNAQQVLYRLQNIIYKKYFNLSKQFQYLVCSVRSSRRALKSERSYQEDVVDEIKVLEQTETKAYAMLPLGYKKILNHYKAIYTPLSLWSNLTVEKLDRLYYEVNFSDGSNNRELEIMVGEVSKVIGSGLRVWIKTPMHGDFGLISTDNYLNAIITALGNFGYDSDELYSLFPVRVQLFKKYSSILYDSKTDKFENLGNAVFAYVVLVDLKLGNYKSPRYTGQANIDTSRLDAIVEGISERNFYKMATNAFSSIEKFDARRIGEYKGKQFLNKIKNLVFFQGATAAYLNLDGRSLIVLCRFEKQAQRINNLLRSRFKLNDNLLTSLKTDVVHQESKSAVLRSVLPSIKEEEITYDESSPFLNLEEITDYDLEENRYRKPKRRKRTEILSERRGCEGLLLLNSGGSIFKHYDFIDIASYFNKFFSGKCIRFELDGIEIPVEFKTEYLPHILGIHLLDEKDPSLRGKAGFQRLLSGDIFYRNIKKSGRVDEKTLKVILNKTQSSVMIFNDIFHNRSDSFYCFPRDVIVGSDTKMEKFAFGITRMLSDNLFHKQNLLGIGKDQRTNKYFFYTSFIWKVPAHIGKKDSYRIVIL